MILSPVQLTVLLGPTVPVPASVPVLEALDKVEVTHSDEGRSGFQITLRAGRAGASSLVDYPLLALPALKPFSRAILVVIINGVPQVLMDGIVTHQQLVPGNEAGAAGTLTLTGEDVSVMMDLEERSADHPAQDETVIAGKLIAAYAKYGLVPQVTPPTVVDPPLPTDRVPVQQATDLGYLQHLAERNGYVFYVVPGPAPGLNTAYWGPPKRLDAPQRALSVDLGPESNVDSIHFSSSALAPTLVEGKVQDRSSNEASPVQTTASTLSPLSAQPALTSSPSVRKVQFRDSGVSSTQATARAQALTNRSADAVTAEGELDSLRYGGLLQARALVDVRGAGFTNSGTYYVKRVSHTIVPGTSYKQRFTLRRDGAGALRPSVTP